MTIFFGRLARCDLARAWIEYLLKTAPFQSRGIGINERAGVISCSCQTTDATWCKCALRSSPIQVRPARNLTNVGKQIVSTSRLLLLVSLEAVNMN